jgi:nucleotide-binding universal stress UspA family protein
MFKRILVPLDGSAIAEQVLDTAADLAKRAGATLLLAHADTPENYIYVESLPVIDEGGKPLQGTHEREYLRRIKQRLEDDWRIPVEFSVLYESGATSAEMLAEHIADADVDLVAMTTHGRGGLERLWLGSVADQLIRTMSVPIFLLRPDGVASASALPAIKRVLAPLDGSTLADRVLPMALYLADALAAELMLMRVVSVGEQVSVSSFGVPKAETNDSFERHVQEAQNYLDSTAKSFPRRAERVTVHIAVSGHVANTILETAAAQPGTMIAMTTHARSGLKRLFLGSVADKVVRGSKMPVLLYKPGEQD